MTDALAPTPRPSLLAQAGAAADRAAARRVFADHQARLAPNTRRRNALALSTFAAFLRAAGVDLDAAALAHDPHAWQGVTWGLVAGFGRWLLAEGYAVGTVNVHLAAIKGYCRLAAQVGAIDPAALALIQTVKGYGRQQGRNLDEERPVTRRGDKKAAPAPLTPEQARALKQQPATPQGRRDALLMCLLLDHGLRVGEVAELPATALDARGGWLTFYRRKVDKVQTHKLTADTLRAALAYLAHDAPAVGTLLAGSRKDGTLAGGLAARSIRERVRRLGAAVGVAALSPHDCRHYWATAAMRNGTDIKALQEAGGWASPDMPLRYAEAARVANAGVKLD